MSALEMRSPSTSSTIRTVPCMAGCDGPMFSGTGSVGRSGAPRSSASWKPRTIWRRVSAISSVVLMLGSSFTLLGLGPAHERLPLLLRVILAQRVPDELGIHQDTAQVRVALEADAVKVVRLALEPVRPLPDAAQRVDRRVVLGAAAVEANAVLEADRIDVQHDVEARLRRETIDAGQVDEHLHLRRRVVAQERGDRNPGVTPHARPLVAVLRARLEDLAAPKLSRQTIEDDLRHRLHSLRGISPCLLRPAAGSPPPARRKRCPSSWRPAPPARSR